MTDRELLKLAAKAAGYEVKWSDITECFWISENSCFDEDSWIPLTDDGDALRLAVKLKLSLYINHAVRVDYRIPDKLTVPLYEPIEPNVYAATRRAIVRAAAEIGKEQA